MRLKTQGQNNFHQAAYIFMLPCPFDKLFACILHLKYHICTCPVPLKQCKCFKVHVVASRYTAQGKCWLEILTHQYGFATAWRRRA